MSSANRRAHAPTMNSNWYTNTNTQKSDDEFDLLNKNVLCSGLSFEKCCLISTITVITLYSLLVLCADMVQLVESARSQSALHLFDCRAGGKQVIWRRISRVAAYKTTLNWDKEEYKHIFWYTLFGFSGPHICNRIDKSQHFVN